ncbi:MAG: hypothetical protein WAL45_00540 [Terracidiphilus sp.]
MSMTRTEKVASIIIVAATVGIIACFLVLGMQRPTKYKMAFNATLNSYLSNHQACLWQDSIQLPARVDIDNEAQTARFNALVDAGLLDRKPAARDRHDKHAAKAVEYTLSDMGRLNWTADWNRLGYGNFCIGHMQVSSVNHYQRLGSLRSPAFQVRYRDSVTLPAWALDPQVEKAFPQLVRESRGETDFATLIRRGNSWRVQTITSPGQPVA